MDAENAQYERVSWNRSQLIDRNKAGKARWGRKTWWWLAPLIALPLLALGAWLSITHIQGDIEEAAKEILIANDVDIDNLDFDASYRDIEITGELAAGEDPARLEALLEEAEGAEEGEDIRDATILATAAAVAMGPLDAALTSDGESITLTGTVPTQKNREDLIAAAEGSGLLVNADGLTVSGLTPSSSNADDQIQKLGAVAGGLGGSAIISAALSIDDEGPVRGEILAATADSQSLLQQSAGADVDVTAPEVLGALDVQTTFDGQGIVLTGTVLTQEQSDALEAAAADEVGADQVVNNLTVSGLDELNAGADDRVAALAAAIGTFDGLTSADATLNDTDLTVNGMAPDEAAQAATLAAVEAADAAGLRPGGEISVPEVEEISLQEEINLLQAELDALQEEIRKNVVFASNSDVLTPKAQATLDEVVDAMVRYPRPVVEVAGHTDSQGDEQFNIDLSQRRAAAVVEYVGSKTSPDRLKPNGVGEADPIADNTTEEGRLQNRRVEFIAKESF